MKLFRSNDSSNQCSSSNDRNPLYLFEEQIYRVLTLPTGCLVAIVLWKAYCQQIPLSPRQEIVIMTSIIGQVACFTVLAFCLTIVTNWRRYRQQDAVEAKKRRTIRRTASSRLCEYRAERALSESWSCEQGEVHDDSVVVALHNLEGELLNQYTFHTHCTTVGTQTYLSANAESQHLN